jgi:hypothetical protein
MLHMDAFGVNGNHHGISRRDTTCYVAVPIQNNMAGTGSCGLPNQWGNRSPNGSPNRSKSHIASDCCNGCWSEWTYVWSDDWQSELRYRSSSYSGVDSWNVSWYQSPSGSMSCWRYESASQLPLRSSSQSWTHRPNHLLNEWTNYPPTHKLRSSSPSLDCTPCRTGSGVMPGLSLHSFRFGNSGSNPGGAATSASHPGTAREERSAAHST